MLLSLPLALTACGGLPVAEPALPPSLTAPCTVPQALPDRALTRAETEVLWGRDRSALRACGDRMAAIGAASR